MSNTNESKNLPSERVLDEKWDECLANVLVKGGIGLSAGIVTSVLLFRRRPWPVWLGTGFGVGHAYCDCQRQFHPSAAFATKPATSSKP